MDQMTPNPRKPLVSIILPTYNRGHLLRRAIESVLHQTYENFELIVVDDASVDDTEDVLTSIRDSRLKFIRHDVNRGGGGARNTGIQAARGELIAFQDSDDEWLPSKLELQVGVLEGAPAKVGVVYSGFWCVDEGKRSYLPSAKISTRSGYIHNGLLRKNFVTTPSILTRKECLLRVGLFDESLPRLQDWDLVIRLSRDYEFICIDEPLLTSYISSDSISRDDKAFIEAQQLIFEKYNAEFKNAGILAHHYYSLYRYLLQDRQSRVGLHYLVNAMKIEPLSINVPISILLLLPFGHTMFDAVKRIVRH